VNNESERIWKEVIVACFEVLSWNFLGKYEENREHLGQDNWCPRQRPERGFFQMIVRIVTGSVSLLGKTILSYTKRIP
jgi:hypothetical protein